MAKTHVLIAGIASALVLVMLVGWAVAGSPVAWMGWMTGAHGAGMGMGDDSMAGHMASPAAACTSGCGGNLSVVMKSNVFSPRALTVHVGDTVTWVNRDAVSHTVTSDSGSALASGMIEGGKSWTHRFATAGTFAYHCDPHAYRDANGRWQGMTATVTVQ